jgi:murein DD-endopeptidase MepM/ murein hydrolase activator NlpD
MGAKNVTFLIVTDPSKATKKIVLPTLWLKLTSVFIVFLSISLVAFALDYMGMLYESFENKKLNIENLQLKKQFQVVETKLYALESSLERVKTFSTKLKLITNVDEENRGLKLSIGTEPKPGQALPETKEPIEQRESLSQMVAEEEQFSEDGPMPMTKPESRAGDLAVDAPRNYTTLAIRIDQAVKETQIREQSVLDLWEILAERQSLLNATPSIRPTRGWLSSTFGHRISPQTGKPAMHYGLDLAAAPGTPVYAPADGVVTYASYDESYGKLVTLDHGYGVMTRLGHNSQIFVHVGQRVSRWDIVSSVGSTGRSTGPHLHYEVRINNIPVDPINYLLDE